MKTTSSLTTTRENTWNISECQTAKDLRVYYKRDPGDVLSKIQNAPREDLHSPSVRNIAYGYRAISRIAPERFRQQEILHICLTVQLFFETNKVTSIGKLPRKMLNLSKTIFVFPNNIFCIKLADPQIEPGANKAIYTDSLLVIPQFKTCEKIALLMGNAAKDLNAEEVEMMNYLSAFKEFPTMLFNFSYFGKAKGEIEEVKKNVVGQIKYQGSLDDFFFEPLCIEELIKIARGMTRAVKKLDELGHISRDIKVENFLYNTVRRQVTDSDGVENDFEIYLTDFASVCQKRSFDEVHRGLGDFFHLTFKYTSCESICRVSRATSSELVGESMWALGVSLDTLYWAKKPSWDHDSNTLEQRFIKTYINLFIVNKMTPEEGDPIISAILNTAGNQLLRQKIIAEHQKYELLYQKFMQSKSLGKVLSKQEEFVLLICQILRYKPEDRLNFDKILTRLDEIEAMES